MRISGENLCITFLLNTEYAAHIQTATSISRSPLFKDRSRIKDKFALVIVKKTPKKDKIIPIALLGVILSLRNIIHKIVVIMGFVAPIKEEFIAVVYFKAVKKKIWYPNIPIIPVNKNIGMSFLVNL